MGINYNSYFSNQFYKSSNVLAFNEFNPPPIDMSVKSTTTLGVSPSQDSIVDQVLHFMTRLETELNKRYPHGCKLVGVGRSPSLLIELFKVKGYDAQSCAISGLSNCEFDITGHSFYFNRLHENDVKHYGEYLVKQGLSADTIHKASVPTVFIDYTRTGETLRKFAQLLARPEIGIRHNVDFLSINRDLLPELTLLEQKMILHLWENCGLKEYSFVPKLDISLLQDTETITKAFKPSAEALEFLELAKRKMLSFKY